MTSSYFSRMSLSVLARGIIVIILTSAILIGAAFTFIVFKVNSSEHVSGELRKLANPMDPAINKVVAALGYGGMVHSFKNAVIRGGTQPAEEARRKIGAVLAGLEDVAALDTANRADVDTIIATMHEYEKNIGKAEFLRSVGTEAERVDAEVSVQDADALTALGAIVARVGHAPGPRSKAQILSELRWIIGYGGAIHNFKNYVLRKDVKFANRAMESFAKAREEIADYRTRVITTDEAAALDTFGDVIDAYVAAIDKTKTLASQGATTDQIDQGIKISDGPAIAALGVLDRAILLDVEGMAGTLSTQLNQAKIVSILVAGGVILLGVAISLTVGLALNRGAVRPARRISTAMEQLADGNTDVEFPDQNDQTEIGIIAGVADQFRETLRLNQKLRADSEAQAKQHEAMAEQQASLLKEQKAMEEQRRLDSDALAQRKALQDDLQERIATVVSAAIAGDFSARIDRSFDAEDLDQLASHFNDLLSSVGRGVDAVAAVTHEMARGDLSARMDGDFQGAFLLLQNSFNDALGEIARLVEEVLSNAVSIDGEASAIASASSDLSRRTETQAATLEETAAAVTHLAASVKMVADNSGEARNMAGRAGEVAGESGAVVEGAVAAMDRIVASSSKISKVTALIDDIAFQTNLLALNAGVEAARAGESGRGFAVVATEVRALAHRSSDAAKEINGLIATSEGEIGAGAEKISKAGDSIREIANYVTTLREAIDSVAAATSEQSMSLEEVTAAMNQLDSVTQQNVAMFEETTASTAALRSRSAELVEAGSRFRTNAHAAADWDKGDTWDAPGGNAWQDQSDANAV